MYLTRRLFSLANQFEHYAKYQPTPVTLKSLIDFGMFLSIRTGMFIFHFLAVDGDMKESYKFLRMELLVRWSHMRKEMNLIPARFERKVRESIKESSIEFTDFWKCQVLNWLILCTIKVFPKF